MEGFQKGWEDGGRDIGDSSGRWKDPSRGGGNPAGDGGIPAGFGAVAAGAGSLVEIPGMPAGTAAMPAGNGGVPSGGGGGTEMQGEKHRQYDFNGVLRQLRPLATRIHSSKP